LREIKLYADYCCATLVKRQWADAAVQRHWLWFSIFRDEITWSPSDKRPLREFSNVFRGRDLSELCGTPQRQLQAEAKILSTFGGNSSNLEVL
jgi:hypothetical protein